MFSLDHNSFVSIQNYVITVPDNIGFRQMLELFLERRFFKKFQVCRVLREVDFDRQR